LGRFFYHPPVQSVTPIALDLYASPFFIPFGSSLPLSRVLFSLLPTSCQEETLLKVLAIFAAVTLDLPGNSCIRTRLWSGLFFGFHRPLQAFSERVPLFRPMLFQVEVISRPSEVEHLPPSFFKKTVLALFALLAPRWSPRLPGVGLEFPSNALPDVNSVRKTLRLLRWVPGLSQGFLSIETDLPILRPS